MVTKFEMSMRKLLCRSWKN